jgi:hypothetical protein
MGGAVTYAIDGRQYIAITAGGGPTIAALSVGMTPQTDTASGSNAVYVFALPQ